MKVGDKLSFGHQYCQGMTSPVMKGKTYLVSDTLPMRSESRAWDQREYVTPGRDFLTVCDDGIEKRCHRKKKTGAFVVFFLKPPTSPYFSLFPTL